MEPKKMKLCLVQIIFLSKNGGCTIFRGASRSFFGLFFWYCPQYMAISERRIPGILKLLKLLNPPIHQEGVSKNRGTPKSSLLIGFSIINHPFWGTTVFGNIQEGVSRILANPRFDGTVDGSFFHDGFKDGGWIQDDHQNQNGEVGK